MAQDKTDKTDETPAAANQRNEKLKALNQAVRVLPGFEAHHHIVLNAEAEFILRLASNLAEEKALDRPASKKDTKTEIERAVKLARGLAKHLKELHSPAFCALDSWGCDPSGLVQPLHDFAAKAARPEVVAQALSVTSDKSGRKTDREANILAFQCALTYWKVTGKAPTITVYPSELKATAGGPFVEFLARVFEIFGIGACIEVRARAARDAVRKLYEN